MLCRFTVWRDILTGGKEMKWVTYTGLTLDFVSFWLVAPAIMGERLLNGLRRGISTGSRAVVWLVAIVIGHLVGWVVWIGFLLALFSLQGDPSLWILLLLYLVFNVVGLVVTTSSQNFMYKKWVEPILAQLSDDRLFRRHVFIIGCVMFTLGFILQLIGVTS
jgi:hypothetical protein